MQTSRPLPTAYAPRLTPASETPLILRLFAAYTAWEDRKRQERKLREMPAHRLQDMGLTAEDIDRAFR